MRKILLLAVFALFGALLQAQPVLDQTAVGTIGSIYYLGIQDTFSPGFSIGSAGANQTWILDTLRVDGFDTISFVSPSSSSYASNFPTANLAIEQASLAGGVAFLTSSPAGLDLQGVVADLLGTGTPIVVHQTPASRVAQFPFTYLNTFQNTTTVDVTIDASGLGVPFVDSARTKRIQDRNLMADGYGSLALPGATFTNVLRVKEIVLETDSVWIHSFLGWSLFQDSVYTDSTFTWWNTSKGYYLATASYIGGQLNTIRYQDPVVVGIPRPTAISYNVYPNPVHDRLYIDTDGKVSALRITDLQGREVARHRLTELHTSLAVGDLPAGCYLYALLDKNGLPKQQGKIILSH
jgi:Secretion system C-terminal sorting domain